MAKSEQRKIRLKRSILLPDAEGKHQHTKKGDVLNLPTALAHSLVGEGSAEYHEDSIDEVMEENRRGVVVHDPAVQNREPKVKKA